MGYFLKTVILIVTLGLAAQAECIELSDPTRPFDFDDTKPLVLDKKLEVNAIFMTNNRSVVIINEQILKKGDSIAGYQIVDIQASAVRLKGAKGIFVMPLVAGGIKTPPYHSSLKNISE